MHKSILVLEESSIVHELFDSAFQQDYPNWNISHESQPNNYVVKTKEIQPDIILLSNRDQKNDYAIVKNIKSHSLLNDVPILLLIYAKDKLDENKLQSLGIKGFVRKPFESSTIKNQIEIVFKNQDLKRKEQPNPDLDELDIVDDELIGLISGKVPSPISIDNLEAELDPTLQLHPIEAESILEDEYKNPDSYDETSFIEDTSDFALEDTEIEDFDDAEILEIDSSEEMEITDFDASEGSDDDIEILEIDSANAFYDEPDELIETELLDMESDDEIDDDSIEFIDTEGFTTPYEPDFEELDQGKTEAIEIELEEISLDFDDDDTELPTITELEQTQYQTLELIQSSKPIKSSFLQNTSDDDDFGIMEIEVIQFDDLDSDEMEELSEEKIYLDDDYEDSPLSDNEGYYTTLEVVYEDPDDTIEIEHTKIEEEIDDDLHDDIHDDFDESLLQEISVEGFEGELDAEENDESYIESISIETDIDEEDSVVSIETLIDDGEPEELDEISIIEQEEETSNLEVNFDDVDEFEETNSLEVDEETEEDPLNFDLDELESDGSQLSIQEMINFRQVMKAKYEISDKDESEETSDFDEYDDDMDLESESEFQNETDSDEEDESLFDDEDSPDELLQQDAESYDEIELIQDEILDEEVQVDQDISFEEEEEEELFSEEIPEEDDQDEDLLEQDFDDEPMVEMELMQDELLDDDTEEEQDISFEEEPGDDELFSEEIPAEDDQGEDLLEQNFDDEPMVEMEMIQDELLDDDIQEDEEELLEDPIENMDPVEEDDQQEIDLLSDDLKNIPNEFSLMNDETTTAEIKTTPDDSLTEPDDLFDDSLTDDFENLENADEVTIEVPSDVFEMGDFKMERISENLEEEIGEDSETMAIDDTDEEVKEDIFSENIKLPSMDEDLPELPPISETEVEEDLFDDFALTDKSDDIETTTTAFDNGIKVLQDDEDFDSFPDETSIIGDPESSSDPASQTADTPKKMERFLSPDFKNRLSSLIEGIVSETVHNTLSSKLPELVDKIIQDEFGD